VLDARDYLLPRYCPFQPLLILCLFPKPLYGYKVRTELGNDASANVFFLISTATKGTQLIRSNFYYINIKPLPCLDSESNTRFFRKLSRHFLPNFLLQISCNIIALPQILYCTTTVQTVKQLGFTYTYPQR